MSCRKQYNYFSKAKNEFIPAATTVKVDPAIVVKSNDDNRIESNRPVREYEDDPPKKKKKKYLPGERLLKKLSKNKVKKKKTTMDRILESFRKQI